MQIMKKVLSAIRNSNADNEKSTSAIRNSLKKHDTLYSAIQSSPRSLPALLRSGLRMRGKSPNISMSKFSISDGHEGERLKRKVGGLPSLPTVGKDKRAKG